VRLDDVAEDRSPFGVPTLPADATADDEILTTADAGAEFEQPGGDILASPAKAFLGTPRRSVAECKGNLGLEEAALVTGESPSGLEDEFVGRWKGVGHGSTSAAVGGSGLIIPQPKSRRKQNLVQSPDRGV